MKRLSQVNGKATPLPKPPTDGRWIGFPRWQAVLGERQARRRKYCERCSLELRDGICQNYGCEHQRILSDIDASE